MELNNLIFTEKGIRVLVIQNRTFPGSLPDNYVRSSYFISIMKEYRNLRENENMGKEEAINTLFDETKKDLFYIQTFFKYMSTTGITNPTIKKFFGNFEEFNA